MAEFLESKGYHADALQGGFDVWKNAGFPVEKRGTGYSVESPHGRLQKAA